MSGCNSGIVNRQLLIVYALIAGACSGVSTELKMQWGGAFSPGRRTGDRD